MLLGVPICFGSVYYDATASLNAVLPALTPTSRNPRWAVTAKSPHAPKISATFSAPLCFTYSADKGVRLSAIINLLMEETFNAHSQSYVCVPINFRLTFALKLWRGRFGPDAANPTNRLHFHHWNGSSAPSRSAL